MSEQDVWRNYAEALLRVAAEQERVDEVGRELALFSALWASHTDLGRLLKTPRIQKSARKKIVDRIAGREGIGALASDFIKLLIDNRRIGCVPDISKEYGRLADMRARRQTAHVTSAIPLDETRERKLATILEKLTGGSVKLDVTVDRGLIGGVVARVGDRLFDGSVRGELGSLRQKLMEGED